MEVFRFTWEKYNDFFSLRNYCLGCFVVSLFLFFWHSFPNVCFLCNLVFVVLGKPSPDFRILHAALVEISFSILVVFSRLSILFLVLLFPPACLRKHFLVQTLNERRCSSPSDSDGGDITRNKCLSVSQSQSLLTKKKTAAALTTTTSSSYR